MFKRIMGGLLYAASITVWADTSCPPVSCDCASIPNADWRHECLQQELQANIACSSGQQPSACLTPGPGGMAPHLWVANLNQQATTDPQATIERGQLLSWMVREANTQAILLQERGDWRGALAQRQQESRAQQQIYQLALGLAEYYEANGQARERESLFNDLIQRNQHDAERTAQSAEALWQSIAASSGADVAVQQALAQRMMRNAGDVMAQAADVARRSGQSAESAKLWQRTAELTVQLLTWAQAAGGSDKTQTLYRQRAAARWYQAGLMALVSGDDQAAATAKQRSEGLRQAGS